jgi:hypothetical protein
MFRPAPFLVTLLDRVKAVVRRVMRPGVERSAPASVATRRPISPVMRGRADGWLSAKLRRLSALLRRIEAGEPGDPRGPRWRKAAGASLAPVPLAAEEHLPRGFGWMCAFGPDVRADGVAFAEWLGEPAMRAKVLAAPERMAPVIGPILAATGERMPEWFPRLPKRPRARSLGSCFGGGICADEALPCTGAQTDAAKSSVRGMPPLASKPATPGTCPGSDLRYARAPDICGVAFLRRRKIKTNWALRIPASISLRYRTEN